MNLLKRIWRRLMWDRIEARANAQWTVHRLRMIDVAKDRDDAVAWAKAAESRFKEVDTENIRLNIKLRERKKHLKIANCALAIRHWQTEALNGRVLTLCEQRAELHKRIQELEAWIEREGIQNETCTFSILRKVCDGCRCERREKK